MVLSERLTPTLPPQGTRQPHIHPSPLLQSKGTAALPGGLENTQDLCAPARTIYLPYRLDDYTALLLLTTVCTQNKHVALLLPLQSILDSPNTHKTPLWWNSALSAWQSTLCLTPMSPWEIFCPVWSRLSRRKTDRNLIQQRNSRKLSHSLQGKG